MKSYSFKNINESESKFEIKKDDIILKDGRSVAQTYFPGRPCRVIADVNKNVGGEALLYRVAVADGKRNDIESVMVSKVTEDIVADVCVSAIEWCDGDLKDFVEIDFYTNFDKRGCAIVNSKTGKVITDLKGSCGPLFDNIIYSFSYNDDTLTIWEYTDGQLNEIYKSKADRAPYGWQIGDYNAHNVVVIKSDWGGYKLYCVDKHKFITPDWCTGYDEYNVSTGRDFANKDGDIEDINYLAIEYDGFNSSKKITLYDVNTLEPIDVEPVSGVFTLPNSYIPILRSLSKPYKWNILGPDNKLVLDEWANDIRESTEKHFENGYVIICEYDDDTFDIVGGESACVFKNGPFDEMKYIEKNDTHEDIICFRRASDGKSNIICSEIFSVKKYYDEFDWVLYKWADDILSLKTKKSSQIIIKQGELYYTYYFGRLIYGAVKIFSKPNLNVCIAIEDNNVSIIKKEEYYENSEVKYIVENADDISIFGDVILVSSKGKYKFLDCNGEDVCFYGIDGIEDDTYFEDADDCKEINRAYIYHVKIKNKWMWINEDGDECDENGEPI